MKKYRWKNVYAVFMLPKHGTARQMAVMPGGYTGQKALQMFCKEHGNPIQNCDCYKNEAGEWETEIKGIVFTARSIPNPHPNNLKEIKI